MLRTPARPVQNGARRELSLFIEELCCELCRFEHVVTDGCAPESIRVDREVNVGSAHAFADIRVRPPSRPPYYVEVKLDYSPDQLVRQLKRKYALETPAIQQARKLVLVVDTRQYDDWPATVERVREGISPHLTLEVWDEKRLRDLVAERFGVKVDEIDEGNAQQVRTAIDRAKGAAAFGEPLETHVNSTLQSTLLYHLDFWRLRQIRESGEGRTARDIVPPGLYPGAVLIADLCSYSSYVRDTHDDEVIRHSMTTFYSRGRYQIRSSGGMLHQFVGDQIVGFFGIPDRKADFVADALDCARALIDIGNSVSEEWQRHIDRIPESGGLHIGIAIGDLQLIPERPFSRTHIAAVGDAIDVARRLTAEARANEIMVSNSFYHLLDDHEQDMFEEAEPVASRSLGKIKSWRYRPRRTSDF
jgi:class 3 adenylate cyclase